MEYINEIGWLLLWPAVLYTAYKFAIKNVLKYEKEEKK